MITWKEGSLEVEPPRNVFESHSLYFSYICDQRPFLISEFYWKSTKKYQFLKARRKCSWFAGIKYCIEKSYKLELNFHAFKKQVPSSAAEITGVTSR